MGSIFSVDRPEPTIRLTRKQLLALGVSETLVDLLTFSTVQSNNPDASELTIKLTRKQLLAIGVSETLVDLLAFSTVQSNELALSADRVSPDDQIEPRPAIEVIQTEVKLNDLPELPFELILSYLSLEDRIKSRAVSRRWYNVINNFRLKSLCYSDRPSGFIYQKNCLVSGAFAQNFINSTKFGPFFQTFGQSILVNLKHLRLCNLDLNAENTPASFVQILNSFDQLKELDLFLIYHKSQLDSDRFQVRLNLPMLKSVQLVQLLAFEKLTLDAPRLQNVKLMKCPEDLETELVHGESVEKLVIEELDGMEVKNLKNLKYLYCGKCYCEHHSTIDPALLSTLEQLKEIHLHSKDDVSNLFQQKERYGRLNLKIFLCGCLLNGPNEPAIESLSDGNRGYLRYLIENPSKVAKEIPLYDALRYSEIKAVAPGQEIDLLTRFTDLEFIVVDEPVQDVDRFLELLKNLNNIPGIDFEDSNQPPELFDRLPKHCAVQSLIFGNAPADWNFLLKLKSLIYLLHSFSIDIELVPRLFEELPFLLRFYFRHLNAKFIIDHSEQFTVSFGAEETKVSDVNAVVQWISEKARGDEESEDEE